MVSSRKSIAGSGWVTTVSLTRETARGERARSTRHSSLASPRERAVSAYQGQPTRCTDPGPKGPLCDGDSAAGGDTLNRKVARCRGGRFCDGASQPALAQPPTDERSVLEPRLSTTAPGQ